MDIITRQEEIDGRWYIWVAYDGFNCVMFEDDHEMSEAEAQQKLQEFQDRLTAQEATDGTTQ